MAHPMGESKPGCLRVVFDRRLKLEFHGSKITSDAGLLAYRELDDALGLTEMAEGVFQDSRTGKNGWHGMTGQFRQSVFGRLGGDDDVNDADRLGRDPAMRWIVGGKAIERQAASTSQMGRFETELLATDENVEALVDMNGVWIDKVHDRHPPKMIILDMDSTDTAIASRLRTPHRSPTMRATISASSAVATGASAMERPSGSSMCQPDPWRTRGNSVQWSLRLYLLASAIPVQPVRRLGEMFPAPR